MDTKKIKEYIQLHTEKRSAEARLKVIKDNIAVLEPMVSDILTEEGVQNVKIDNSMAYLHKELFASLVRDDDNSHEAAHQALKDNGLDSMVKEGVNAQTLKAYVTELDKAEEPVPEGLAPYLKISEVYRVRVRT